MFLGTCLPLVRKDNTSTQAGSRRTGRPASGRAGRWGRKRCGCWFELGLECQLFAFCVHKEREMTAYLLRTTRDLEVPEPAGAFVVGIRAWIMLDSDSFIHMAVPLHHRLTLVFGSQAYCVAQQASGDEIFYIFLRKHDNV